MLSPSKPVHFFFTSRIKVQAASNTYFKITVEDSYEKKMCWYLMFSEKISDLTNHLFQISKGNFTFTVTVIVYYSKDVTFPNKGCFKFQKGFYIYTHCV